MAFCLFGKIWKVRTYRRWSVARLNRHAIPCFPHLIENAKTLITGFQHLSSSAGNHLKPLAKRSWPCYDQESHIPQALSVGSRHRFLPIVLLFIESFNLHAILRLWNCQQLSLTSLSINWFFGS